MADNYIEKEISEEIDNFIKYMGCSDLSACLRVFYKASATLSLNSSNPMKEKRKNITKEIIKEKYYNIWEQNLQEIYDKVSPMLEYPPIYISYARRGNLNNKDYIPSKIRRKIKKIEGGVIYVTCTRTTKKYKLSGKNALHFYQFIDKNLKGKNKKRAHKEYSQFIIDNEQLELTEKECMFFITGSIQQSMDEEYKQWINNITGEYSVQLNIDESLENKINLIISRMGEAINRFKFNVFNDDILLDSIINTQIDLGYVL